MATFATNNIDMPSSIFGTLWAGGVVSPANPTYSAQELAFQLKDSEARAILTEEHLLKPVLQATKIVGISEDHILLIGNERSKHFQHFKDFQQATGNSKVKRIVQRPTDLALIHTPPVLWVYQKE